MYAWIWRQLPGPTFVKVIAAIIIVLAVVMLLMTIVFPAIEPYMPFGEGDPVATS